jgi:hypothetical protein
MNELKLEAPPPELKDAGMCGNSIEKAKIMLPNNTVEQIRSRNSSVV